MSQKRVRRVGERKPALNSKRAPGTRARAKTPGPRLVIEATPTVATGVNDEDRRQAARALRMLAELPLASQALLVNEPGCHMEDKPNIPELLDNLFMDTWNENARKAPLDMMAGLICQLVRTVAGETGREAAGDDETAVLRMLAELRAEARELITFDGSIDREKVTGPGVLRQLVEDSIRELLNEGKPSLQAMGQALEVLATSAAAAAPGWLPIDPETDRKLEAQSKRAVADQAWRRCLKLVPRKVAAEAKKLLPRDPDGAAMELFQHLGGLVHERNPQGFAVLADTLAFARRRLEKAKAGTRQRPAEVKRPPARKKSA